MTYAISIGQRLRHERKLLNWSQERLAAEIGTTAVSINRWENDRALPRPYFRERLCEVLHKSAEEVFGLSVGEETALTGHTLHWNVPYLRNLYFTGREATLTHLHETLASQRCVALTALSGLGGIGKTQIALAYAYRYADEYDAVLWARADTYESLVSDFIALAELLALPEKDEADQKCAIAAVKGWLHGHSGWLLIFDNVEDFDIVVDFLPMRGKGHTLLTTRSQATGPHIRRIEIDKMEQAEGALLVLRRAKIIDEDAPVAEASEEDRRSAGALCALMDGLPLALDQAAAYIEEKEYSLQDYLHLYQTRRTELLQQRGALGKRSHPHPVATTWALSFEHVAQANALAADLLRLCAFLHPDAIDTALLTSGMAELGLLSSSTVDEHMLLNEAMAELRKYSLVRRNAEAKTLTIHRLVQVALKDAMDDEMQKQWAERTVRVVNRVFPQVDFTTWSLCQQYLPHAQLCASLIEQWRLDGPEAARLLYQTGAYLQERAQYTEAEPLYRRALALRERLLGPVHLQIAQTLTGLASLYYLQGKYIEAEPLYRRALLICEQSLGPVHAEVAHILNEQALLYDAQGKYEQAEALYQRALAIHEQAPDRDTPGMATSLNNLAQLYWKLGKYAAAETLYQRALAIREQAFGARHPEVATSLNNLATLYWKQGKYVDAEPLYQRALAIREEVLELNHPYLATSLNNLAQLYRDQEQYQAAEPLYRRALSILEERVGSNHPYVAACLNNLALLYSRQSRYEEAEPLYQRALAIVEHGLKANHPHIAQCLNDLATLYRQQGRYEQAEPLYQRALAIREEALGASHPDVAQSLYDLALLYSSQCKYEQAQPLYARALAIRAQTLGSNHPRYLSVLQDYSELLQKTGESERAADEC